MLQLKVNIIEVTDIPSVLKVLIIKLEMEKETLLLAIVYCILGPLGSFIDDVILLINELPTHHSMLIVGDFNLYQMFPEHVVKVDPLIQNFNMSQFSQYSAHAREGILDLVFDTSNSNIVSSLLSPYSVDVVIFLSTFHKLYLYRI